MASISNLSALLTLLPVTIGAMAISTLLEAARSFEAPYLALLEKLVTYETPTAEKAAADALVTMLEHELATRGWQLARRTLNEVGDQLVLSRDGQGGPATLLLCHYDTVWPLGTLAKMPFRRDGDRVYGPGVLDMKAGIVTALLSPEVLAQAGFELAGKVTVLLTSDEETGSHHSRALIEELARAHDRVFVLEPGREDGALKIARKGVGDFRVHLQGVSAHAGNNPQDGASALRELAHFLFYAEALNDPEAQTSVNLTVARGGTVSNVIAEEAFGRLDVRVLQQREAERVTAALYGYTPKDARVKVTVNGGVNRPPMAFTAANRRLFEAAQARLKALGLALEGATVGGGSDGNFTSALGIATLDGLGAVGEGPHARHEHIRLGETLERLALVAALLAR